MALEMSACECRTSPGRTSQSNGLTSVATGKNPRENLIHVLGRRIRRKRLSNALLPLRKLQIISVDRTAGGIHQSPDTIVPRRHQHIEKSRDIAFKTAQRI